jgi:transglutaminase-like putative cysteine protease
MHEYFPPDPVEDLRFGATTGDGAMAAAIQTENGAVQAPDLKKPPAPGTVYDRKREGESAFRLDGDTSKPPRVTYDDPFTPEVTPFKRLFAYDRVTDSLELVVGDPRQVPLSVGGTAKANDDQFFADIQVDLVKDQAVRIPTVGPSARVLGLRTDPMTAVELLRDGADNWFVKAKSSGRVRLAMQLAIDRAIFGSEFADVDARALSASLERARPSSAVKEAAAEVAARVGLSESMRPAAVVRALVGYFRSFSPSDEHPKGKGVDLYKELALSRKGVCRHRAFAFVVTATAAGIPARLVHNEAHAWVEVFDLTRWHRIDLGGAAGFLEEQFHEERPSHVVPRDPYAWPADSDSGQSLADRTRSGRRPGPPNRDAAANPAPSEQGSSEGAQPRQAEPVQSREDDARPPSRVTLRVGTAHALRGSRVQLSGEVEAGGEPCALARVDFFLQPKKASRSWGRIALGTLVTNDEGRYEGRVVVPHAASGGNLAVGDYDVVASTPGNPQCGAGESE